MQRASSRPPTLFGFTFWFLVFGACTALRWGSAGLLLATLAAAPALLLGWALARG